MLGGELGADRKEGKSGRRERCSMGIELDRQRNEQQIWSEWMDTRRDTMEDGELHTE